METLSPEAKSCIHAIKSANPEMGFKRLLTLVRVEHPGVQKQAVKEVLGMTERQLPGDVKVMSAATALETKPNPMTTSVTAVSRTKEISSDTLSSPYKIVDIPGKGRGMVAARAIKAGELVIAEEPLFSIRDLGGQANYIELVRTVLALSPHELAGFYDLHNAHQGKMPPVMDRFSTNSFPLGTEKAGIFLLCSRINSTCMPNVNNTWYDNLGMVLFHATKDTAVGEELGSCYVSPLLCRDERRRLLRERYGFDCACTACTAPPVQLQISETRKKQISDVDKILDGGAIAQPLHNLHLIDRSYDLLLEENLVAHIPMLASTGYQLAYGTGQMDRAKLWAKRVYEYGSMVNGKGDGWLQPFKGYITKPERSLVGTDAMMLEMMKKMGWSDRKISSVLAGKF